MMTAIILCGGEGERIKHITKEVPKCVYPIHDKPFLRYLIDQLENTKLVDRIILLTADKYHTIINSLWPSGGFMMGKFDEYTSIKESDIEFILPKARPGIGTTLALYEAKNFITKFPVLVMNGDTLAEFDLADMLAKHYAKKDSVTVGVHQKIDSGIWLMDEKAFSSLQTARFKLFPKRERWLVSRKENKIGKFKVNKFIDMGTPDGLKMMEEYLENYGN